MRVPCFFSNFADEKPKRGPTSMVENKNILNINKTKNYGILTDEKLVIVGAAGMIGSNMVQTALTMGLTSNICLYDVFSPEGVAEEMRQSGFDGAKITATTDAKEAFTNAKYIISSGGAPRKAGMTREDLLKGNCEIAEGLGKNIKEFCPDVKHVVIIFNPADLTGLVTTQR